MRGVTLGSSPRSSAFPLIDSLLAMTSTAHLNTYRDQVGLAGQADTRPYGGRDGLHGPMPILATIQ